jgi:hypothetical protein
MVSPAEERLKGAMNRVASHAGLGSTPCRILDELFRKARAGEIQLLTSAISRVEVAFTQSEQQAAALDQQTEEAIDALWSG